jgi:hypothetical protein
VPFVCTPPLCYAFSMRSTSHLRKNLMYLFVRKLLKGHTDRNQDSAGAAPRTSEVVAVVPADDWRQVVLRAIHLQCTSLAVIARQCQ